MRSSRMLGAAFLALALTISVFAQQTAPSQSPQRDSQALAAVQKAVSVLGGAGLSQIYDASVQGTIQITSGAPVQSLSVLWEDAWSKGAPAFRRETHLGASTSTLVSGNGQPVDLQDGIATKVPRHTSFTCAAFHLPGILLAAQLNDARYSFKLLPAAVLNGQPAIHIQSLLTTDPLASAVSLQDWYFDPNTGLPLRVDYRAVNSPDVLNPGVVSTQFSNFKPVSGILVPFLLTETGLAGETDIVTITSVTLNSGLSRGEFLPPARGAQ